MRRFTAHTGDLCRVVFCLFAASSLAAPTLLAQLPASDDRWWDARFGPPGTRGSLGDQGSVISLTPAPNGDLYAAGAFTALHGATTTNLARWDGDRWLPVLTGAINGTITGVSFTANGDLYICGSFSQIGGSVMNNIARWNGSAWVALGNGLNGTANQLAWAGNLLLVVGSFSRAGTVDANRIAWWNGSNWGLLGTGPTNGVNGDAYTIAANSRGQVFVGGSFTQAGLVPTGRIARYDTTTGRWTALGSGIPSGVVTELVVHGHDLYVGGTFTSAGGVPAAGLAKWDGTNWSAVAPTVPVTVSALLVAAPDEIVIAGNNRALVWDGAEWTQLGSTFAGENLSLSTLAIAHNTLFLGGRFQSAGGKVTHNLARFDAQDWIPAEEPAHGISADEIRALAIAGRNVYAGGTFRTAGTNWLDRIARWDGAQWHPLGEGIAGFGNLEVRALAARGTNLYVGGFFDQAGGTNAGRIARWDGARWHPLGSGVSGRVLALAVAENGDVYAGGIFEFAGGTPATNIARWNGTNWSQLGRGLAGPVNALKVRGNQLYAGGHFTSDHIFSMTNVAVWNGTFWSSLGNGPNNGVNGGVSALEVIGTNLFVGGQFTRAGTNSAGRIARWDGTRWSALGAGVNDIVYALSSHGGELIAGGWFTQAGGQPALRVARWNGQQWAPLGNGVRGGGNSVYALAADPWSLYVGGGFTYAGEKPAFQIARYGNEPPTVDLTQPHSGSLFFAADTLLLTAEAADRDDSVTRVEFLDGATSLGASLTAPFSLVWSNITPGAHTLRARATDEFGLESSSSPVTVFISVNPLAQAPRRAVQNNSYSSMLLHSSGRLFGWGQNGHGELGNGTNRVAYEPVGTTFPPGVRAWQSIATGEGHTLGIGDDGQLYTWGGNNTGELGQGLQSAPRYEPGRIARPPGVTRWTAVAAGWASSFALGDNGQLYACGWNANRSLGLGSNGIYNVFTLVPPPSGATAWRAIAAGYQHTLGVTDNDRVYAWGNNIFGEAIPTDTATVITNLTPVPLPADAANIITLAAGWHHSLALTREGRLFAWGYNGLGQLGTGTIGGPRMGPLEVPPPPGASRWVDVVVGSDHGLAMASNGELYAWGMNTHGEMGHRDTTYQPAPGLIPRPASVTAWLTFSAGYYHNLAVGNDCRVYVWGDNAWGQLATGTNHAVTNLVQVAALGEVCGALLTTPPTLTLDSPSDGALFGRGDAVPFQATAADADGAVASVEFFVGPRLVGLITNAPWETTWLAGAAGTNVITAIATDHRGAIAVAAPGRIVTGVRPNITIFAPTNAQPIHEGDNVFVAPVTFDPDGSVARVDYYLDGALLRSVSSAGWSFTWSNAPWGDFVLTAVATDNSGLSNTSAPVALHVNARPRITLLSPTNGAVVRWGDPVVFEADATDPDGTITEVSFFSRGPTLTVTNPPFVAVMTNAPWGMHSVYARARDDRGVTVQTPFQTLVVNVPPAVHWLWPSDGTTVNEGTNVVLRVDPLDQERSLHRLDFFADGALIGTILGPTAFWTAEFVWTNPPAGIHGLTATITDNYGASATSRPVHLRVNARPTLAILSPTNGAAFFTDEPIPVVAQATDPDGFVERANLEYAPAHSQSFQYLSLLTNGTSTFTWTNPPYAPGDYPDLRDAASLRVWGGDNTSLIVTSAVVRVRVLGRPKVVAGTTRGGNNHYARGEDIGLWASDQNSGMARLTNVAFYADDVLLGSVTVTLAQSIRLTWSHAPAGLHELIARATDLRGNLATSAPVRVIVDTPPTVSLVSPTNGAAFQAGSDISLEADAADVVGSVTNIWFFEGTNLLATLTNAPSNATWSNVAIGTYDLTAVAVDDFGLAATSAVARITVADTLPPVIVCSSNFSVECPEAWDFVPPTAADDYAGTNVVITVLGTVTNPISGGLYSATRTWRAADPCGNSAECHQTFTVRDRTPPTVTCPSNLSVEFTSQTGAVVRFAATATDSCDAAVSVACVLPSESVFPIGQTPVRCTATDASGNAATCTFTVTVQGARGLKENVLAELTALRATVTRREDADRLDDSITHLTKSLAPELWVDQTHLERKHGDRAIQEEKETIRMLCDLAKDKQGTVPAEVLAGFIDRITSADRLLAAVAIADATAAGAARKKIEHANKELAKGDADLANPKCGDGLENYKQAWKLATRAKLTGTITVRRGRLQLEILGEPGETCLIQASSNLVDWVTLGTRTADQEGIIRFEDRDSGQAPSRFYRVITPEP